MSQRILRLNFSQIIQMGVKKYILTSSKKHILTFCSELWNLFPLTDSLDILKSFSLVTKFFWPYSLDSHLLISNIRYPQGLHLQKQFILYLIWIISFGFSLQSSACCWNWALSDVIHSLSEGSIHVQFHWRRFGHPYMFWSIQRLEN